MNTRISKVCALQFPQAALSPKSWQLKRSLLSSLSFAHLPSQPLFLYTRPKVFFLLKLGALKMTDMKMQDVKLTDHAICRAFAGREIAGHEITGQ